MIEEGVMRTETLLLLDGPSLAYRSYFAFARNPLESSTGELTSVPFGFAVALAKLAQREKPDYWAVAFDMPVPTFRHKEFSAYKANRPGMPDEMAGQLGRVSELLDALRIPRLEMEGYEADDIIGTLAVKAGDRGMKVLVVTEDKDLCQLVDERIHIVTLPKGGRPGKRLDPGGVEEKLGVPPEKVVDLLALVGDSSDNVPGVPGVGPKTARKLLEKFSSLDELYEKVERVEPAHVRQKLENNKESAYMSRRLVSLELEVPVGVELEGLRRSEPDREKLMRLLGELEIARVGESLMADWRGADQGGGERVDREGARSSEPRGTEERGGRSDRLEGICSYLREAPEEGVWAFALGPDSRGSMELALFGAPGGHLRIAVCGDEKEAVRDFLESAAYRKVTHDLKSEAHAVGAAGMRLEGVVGDVMLASYLLNPEEGHDLAGMAGRYLGTVAPAGDGVTAADVLQWKARTAYDLEALLSPRVAAAGVDVLLRDIEVPLALALMEMERDGVAIDLEALERLSKKLDGLLRRSEEDIYCLAGMIFNINSPTQLSDVLFLHLGLPPKRKTKTGYSTDSSVLEELAADHEMPRAILNHRQLAKLKSTYADALPRLIDPATGRIHATFHQTVTATGRLSSSNPNLQNIPIRSELGKEIRKAFVPGSEGWSLLAADYSQIELRIMAHLAGDAALKESFMKGEDPHAATAAAIFGLPAAEVDEELRSRAKTVNYGVMYGMGPRGLAARLGISKKEAEKFIEEYFAKMPAVKGFLSSLVDRARDEGFATTIMNRRRPLPAIHSSDRRARAYAERMAVNTPIQGSAADMIKKAMVEVKRGMSAAGMKAKLILQVHDELVFECPDNEIESLKALVVECMESAAELTVPLEVAVGVGANWWETHR